MDWKTFCDLEAVLRLPFCRWEDKSSLPDLPGIYYLVIEDELLMYIGQSSQSIRSRWLMHGLNERLGLLASHASDFGWYQPLFHIHYHLLGCSQDLETIRKTESALIRRFNPPWNKSLSAHNSGWRIGSIMRHYSTQRN